MPDSRGIDRAVHYAVKTARPQPVSSHSFSHVNSHAQYCHPHSHSHSRSVASSHSFGPPKSTTPLGSPYSVGQSHPPKLSPAAPVTDVRSPSPNYFGLVVDPAQDPNESSAVPAGNWSPPTSSVRSFAAALPKQLPLDANPEFEAFRREADKNRGHSFNFNVAILGNQAAPPGTPGSLRLRPALARGNLQNGSTARPALNMTGSQIESDTDKSHDSAYGSVDSKRNSEEESAIKAGVNRGLSLPRYGSPSQIESLLAKAQRSTLANYEGRQARLSVSQSNGESQLASPTQRAGSLPTKLESGPTMITPGQLKSMLDSAHGQDLLLLDLRVAPQYVSSRIKGALSLCIPTTLLKRATFNLKKLQQTFQNERDQEKFSKWRYTKRLVVYDAASSEKRDAQSAINTLKKFTNEGYTGATYILRGGFNGFATSFPDLVDHSSVVDMAGSCLSLNDKPGPGPKVAPVVGGVMLPTAIKSVNPFFSSIRQNTDLADGVGQIDISVPSGLDAQVLPRWLRNASEQANRGKRVSDKFLHIELSEQSRMKNAYSVSTPASRPENRCVQLSGIEKGGKNRYKDILPFEHARVRLQGKPVGACDYVNASHIKPTRSNKRYIAAQGPLPDTFEDFWSVIWDQDVRVIVMLTAESEGGQLKCHPYWRDKEFGSIKLRMISEKKISLDMDKHRHNSAVSVPQPSSSIPETGRRRANTTTTLEGPTPTPQPIHVQPDAPYVILRKFSLSNSRHPFAPIREITQLHYPSWPDFGAPAQPSHLLALVELANVMQRAAAPVNSSAVMTSSRRNSPDPVLPIPGADEPEPDSHTRPMLVHCSAGCGRTGAFCTIDSVIDMLKRQRLSQFENPKKDPDGDLRMDTDDAVSPMTTSTPYPLPGLSSSSSSSRKVQQLQASNGEGIDLSWLSDDGVDLIEKTVEDFRGQRLSMVQTLRQYVLCYETVIEWVWRAQDRGLRGAGSSDGVTRVRARSGSLSTTAFGRVA